MKNLNFDTALESLSLREWKRSLHATVFPENVRDTLHHADTATFRVGKRHEKRHFDSAVDFIPILTTDFSSFRHFKKGGNFKRSKPDGKNARSCK